MSPVPPQKGIGWSHEEHRREQVRRGLELSAAERLAWLETTMKELRPLVGRAADPASSSPEARDTSGTVLSGEA